MIFDPKQLEAVDQLKNGSILCGSVGSGKSRTGLYYYFVKECKGSIAVNGAGSFKKPSAPKDLYIITTARKRDTLEWEKELVDFRLSTDPDISLPRINVVVDSWNNIKKYANIKNAFFLFDEQRVVGYGAWSKAFIHIAKNNHWILLTATPGDNWDDYIPVFIANGFYKNKTEFERRHNVYARYSNYPKVIKRLDVKRLINLKNSILVMIDYTKPTESHVERIRTAYNKNMYNTLFRERWNVFENKPVENISELCYCLRRVSNTDPSRIAMVRSLLLTAPKVVIFYNFNYELDILIELGKEMNLTTAQWNGHIHEPIPKTDQWMYLVQYAAGAEGWNCVETNTMIFYSQSYSYKQMIQAAGRIDRRNTPFRDLYYYHLSSSSKIDLAIDRCLKKKKKFNESNFVLNSA